MQYNPGYLNVQKIIHYHYHYDKYDFPRQSAYLSTDNHKGQECQQIKFMNVDKNHNQRQFVDQQGWQYQKNPQIDQKYQQIRFNEPMINKFAHKSIAFKEQEQQNSHKCNCKSSIIGCQGQQNLMYNPNNQRVNIKINQNDRKILNNEIQNYENYLNGYKSKNFKKTYSKNYINFRQRQQIAINSKRKSQLYDPSQNIIANNADSFLFTERYQRRKAQQPGEHLLMMNTAQDFYHTPQCVIRNNKQNMSKSTVEHNGLAQTCQSDFGKRTDVTGFTNKQKKNSQYHYKLMREECIYLREKFVRHLQDIHNKRF